MESYLCYSQCSLLLSHSNSRVGLDKSLNSCRVSRNDGISRNILCYDASGADNCLLSNHDIAKQSHSRTNRSAFLHYRPIDLPILFGLQPALRRSCARVGIVNESYAVTNKHVVLDRDAFANEAMAGDLAILSDSRILLNLNKSPNFRVVTDFATIKIDELRQFDVLTKFDVGGNAVMIHHS